METVKPFIDLQILHSVRFNILTYLLCLITIHVKNLDLLISQPLQLCFILHYSSEEVHKWQLVCYCHLTWTVRAQPWSCHIWSCSNINFILVHGIRLACDENLPLTIYTETRVQYFSFKYTKHRWFILQSYLQLSRAQIWASFQHCTTRIWHRKDFSNKFKKTNT